MSQRVRFGIIVPSYNQVNFLGRTLASVLDQQGDFDVRVHVIDGGSTDGTQELLAGLRDDRVHYVSEKDRGQSDAVNKGLRLADGEVIGWLNSDDLYAPGALAAVAKVMADQPAAQWVVGRCDIIDENGREIRQNITRYKNYILSRYSQRRQLRENLISQPAVFWRREFGRQVGELDESLHYTMDYDLWLRMGAICRPVVMDQLLAHFRLHAGSKSGKRDRAQFDEQYRVACRHAAGDRWSLRIHRLNVEKIVFCYRVMKLLGK